jgi:hypothetical protein
MPGALRMISALTERRLLGQLPASLPRTGPPEVPTSATWDWQRIGDVETVESVSVRARNL